MDLTPVARRSLPDAVFEQLITQVLDGSLPPGAALPAERSLTEQLGVNRQAVREALKRLHQAGLVEIVQGDATRVRDYRRSGGLDVLPRLLVRPDGSVDVHVARSVMEMRACIGPDVARLAAERAVPAAADQLAEIVEAMAEAARDASGPGDELEALADLDWAFWEVLIDAADNIAYRLAFNGLRDAARPLAPLMRTLLEVELHDLAAHRALATAVATGQPDRAQRAAQRLLRAGLAAVVTVAAQPEAG